jgi:hypothetical protein
MNAQAAIPSSHSASAYYLGANGALMIFVGLLLGVAIPAAPYPRLMLSVHTLFLEAGMLSIFAGVLLQVRFCILGRAAAAFVVFAHIFEWIVCLSQIAGAEWGTKKALPIAAGQAGAPGGEPWQENLVLICQVVPSVILLISWAVLVWGVFMARKSQA